METNCGYCLAKFTKKYSAQKYCSQACSNRFNLNNKVLFTGPKIKSVELAELFGILLGDGSVEKYFVKIYLNMIADKGYSKNILKILEVSLPKTRVSIRFRSSSGTEEIQISSKDACDYIRSIGFNPKKREVPRWITNKKKFTIATVRGLFDTEGSIGIKYYKSKNGVKIYKQLTVTNSNKSILSFLENSLVQLGFTPTKNSKKNIYISNKKDIEKYFQIIGTSNPKLEKKMKMK